MKNRDKLKRVRLEYLVSFYSGKGYSISKIARIINKSYAHTKNIHEQLQTEEKAG